VGCGKALFGSDQGGFVVRFLEHLTLGQYIPADSLVHRLDPRCKILSTVIILIGVFTAFHPLVFPLWGAFLVFSVLLSRLSLKVLVRSARPVLILVAFTAIVHLFFTGGDALFKLGFLTITSQGANLAVRMGLRLIFLVLFANLMTLTTSPMELADGLERLFSPLKPLGFPAHELAMMMTIALRFIPTLLNETDRIMKAQLARGAELDQGGIIKRLRAFIPVLVPLFVIVFKRADELAVAMEARGYRGGVGRSRMHPLCWSLSDTLALIFVVIVTLVFIYVDRWA